MSFRRKRPTGTDRQDPWTDTLGRAATRSAQWILILALAGVTVFALVQIKLAVIPVLVALILAAAISPMVNALHRRRVPRLLGAWIALVATLGSLTAVVTGVVLAVRSEWEELVESASRGLDELQLWLTSGPLPIDRAQLDQAEQALVAFLGSGEFRAGALTGVSTAGEVIAGALLVLVVLFFFLKDGDRIWSFLTGRLSGERLIKARLAGSRAVEVLGVYVRGTSIVALVDAVVIGVALAVLQVPLALPLAVTVFLGAFVPLLGATLAGALAALVALVANGPVVALIVVIVVVAVNQLEGDLLQPVVLGKSLRLHALVILLALTIGTILGGIIGAVLSVPIAAVGWAVLDTWFGPSRHRVDAG